MNSPQFNSDILEAWKRALGVLEAELGQGEVDGWFAEARLEALDAHQAVVSVPTEYHAVQLRERYPKVLMTALGAAELRIVVRTEPAEDSAPVTIRIPKSPVEAAPAAAPADTPPTLRPHYTFDHYVVGPCNRFAHAAARSVADRPAASFNPLFLHGSVGLGKTHLMQAIAHQLLEENDGIHIVLLSCEEFVNHFIAALQQGNLGAFRHRYREADVLVIDDVHLLANKERTQEEFFHTFNALHNAGKQIVLSSDSPPRDIPSLQERLVSRFKWGLVAEIVPPCFETRMAIVQAKAEQRGFEVNDEVAGLIAETFEDNIRELEGALTKVEAYRGLLGRPLDLALAREALGHELRHRARVIGMDDIVKSVIDYYGVKTSDLQSKKRTQSIVLPRQVAMFLARRITTMSLEEIGRYFGGRDHSTVVYAIEKMDGRRRVDADFGAHLVDLEREIRGGGTAN